MIEDDDSIWDDEESKQFRKLLERHPLYKDHSYGRLIRAVADEAKKAPEGNQCWQLNQGIEVVEEIMRAVNEDGWQMLADDKHQNEKRKYWHHSERARLEGKKRLDPYITVLGVQGAAVLYLQLPYRVQALDRILLDMLIASEMFAFADEMQPILKKKLPLLFGWLVGNVSSLLVCCAAGGFVLWLGGGATITNWIGGAIITLGVARTLWSLIAFPFYYPKLRADRRKFDGIIEAMTDAYSSLGGRPASTKHIEERIARGTDAGVVWPAQLMVLMEDIRSRTLTI